MTAIVGIAVGAAVVFCLHATPLYEAEAEIYPLVMKKDAEMMPLNPCRQVQRIAYSRQFRQLLVESAVCPSLSEDNYDRRIAYYETPRHTLIITARAETPDAAEALNRQFLTQLDFVARQLTSVQMTLDDSLCEQIPWDYYFHQVDFAPESPVLDSSDSTHTYFLFDMLSVPTSSAAPVYPPNILKTAVLTFLISAFLSFVGVCLVEEIRNRLIKHSPAQ